MKLAVFVTAKDESGLVDALDEVREQVANEFRAGQAAAENGDHYTFIVTGWDTPEHDDPTLKEG